MRCARVCECVASCKKNKIKGGQVCFVCLIGRWEESEEMDRIRRTNERKKKKRGTSEVSVRRSQPISEETEDNDPITGRGLAGYDLLHTTYFTRG